jgi:hypothetical protein
MTMMMRVAKSTSRLVLLSAHAPNRGEAKKEPPLFTATAQPTMDCCACITFFKKGQMEGRTIEKQMEERKVTKSMMRIPARKDSGSAGAFVGAFKSPERFSTGTFRVTRLEEEGGNSEVMRGSLSSSREVLTFI